MTLLYRVLLRCYPPRFRRRFGAEMELAFAAGWSAARGHGSLAAATYIWAHIADAIVNGIRERQSHSPYQPVPEENSMISVFVNDVRFAVRLLLRQPVFSLVVVLTLAIGIGATSAIFSVVDGVLIRPLPYRDPERLAFTWTKLAWIGVPRAWINGYHVSVLQDETRLVESFVVMQARDAQLTGLDQPEQVRAGIATPNVFDVLGVRPLLGRGFRPEDGQTGSEHVAVIGHALWQERFGGSSAILGRKITLNGDAVEVVGVMPPNFRFLVHSSLGDPREPDLWVPGTWTFRSMPQDGYSLALLLRVRAGHTMAEAQAELDRIGKRMDHERFRDRGFGWQLTGVQDDLIRKTRPALLMLLGAAAMLLLIVCANVGGLFHVRAAGRDREFAVRCVVGAGRARIVSQLVTEAFLLAGMGAVVGWGMAHLGVRGLLAMPGLDVPRLYDVALNGRVLLFALAAAVMSALAFGLLPALRCSRPNLGIALKEGARGSGGLHGSRLRAIFVVAEIAFALVLLLGASLLVRTFAALQGADPGFRSAGVLTARLILASNKYPRGAGAAEFIHRVIDRLQSVPGVQAAATNAAPLSRSTNQIGVVPEGAAPDSSLLVDALRVTPGYFAAMGVTFRSGRDFSWQDSPSGDPIAIVDDVFARMAWPGQNPVGKYLQMGNDSGKRRQVVALVRQPHLYEVQRDDRPQVFIPYAENPGSGTTLIVHSSNPSGAAATLRQAVWSEDRNQPVASVLLMDEIVSQSLSERRLSAFLLALFAAVSLLLASIGIYGLVAYSVGRRTQEIGIRMALGAEASSIRRMVLGQALRLAAAGVVLGLVGAYGFTRLLTTQLYGVSASDPLTYAGVALSLVAVAAVSSYVPALRASRLDPSVSLRGD